MLLLVPRASLAHPMGNFSISHYAAIRVEREGIELRYIVDMAEIPTFQEMQETGIAPEAPRPSLEGYARRTADALRGGLRVAVNGRPLALRTETADVIFPPGAGGLPTLKLGAVYRAPADRMRDRVNQLEYGDANFPGRAGWKEIVAQVGPGIVLDASSVPLTDRSRQLSDYPSDLLASPPQDLEARIAFAASSVPASDLAATPSPVPRARRPGPPDARTSQSTPRPAAAVPVAATAARIPLRANAQATPPSAFTELIATPERSLRMLLVALVVAAGLGAFHALEPGHGKTVVAAYLVGSRGTAWHATLLGLCVTASHTAGVYLLGGVTLYASRHVVPDRLYPWLGVLSGLTITALGTLLFIRRYARRSDPHAHEHAHGVDAARQRQGHSGAVSLRELAALGVTGGIIPCPAALVVLLGAVSLGRVGFGLILIVAFSIGLAAVLIAVGILMVYARRVMSRWEGEGPLITRWLPLTSAALITVLGVGIAVQAAVAGRILSLRL
jgi:ABC-type nickel/cobalt efflux system permease component RcnA